MNKRLLIALGLIFNTVCPQYFLYAPWRQPITPPKASRDVKKTCCFCNEIKAHQDEKYLILSRATGFIVQLNPKPYSRGSLLIYPTDHVSSLDELSAIQYCDLFLIAKQAMDLLALRLDVDSFSIGMNLGHSSCGSKPEHLHLHIVPRYPKEANGFLETCCSTRLIQHDLQKLYKELKGIECN